MWFWGIAPVYILNKRNIDIDSILQLEEFLENKRKKALVERRSYEEAKEKLGKTIEEKDIESAPEDIKKIFPADRVGISIEEIIEELELKKPNWNF